MENESHRRHCEINALHFVTKCKWLTNRSQWLNSGVKKVRTVIVESMWRNKNAAFWFLLCWLFATIVPSHRLAVLLGYSCFYLSIIYIIEWNFWHILWWHVTPTGDDAPPILQFFFSVQIFKLCMSSYHHWDRLNVDIKNTARGVVQIKKYLQINSRNENSKHSKKGKICEDFKNNIYIYIFFYLLIFY